MPFDPKKQMRKPRFTDKQLVTMRKTASRVVALARPSAKKPEIACPIAWHKKKLIK